MKTSKITIQVTLGEDRIPEKIEWSASDQQGETHEAKAMLLSIFEKPSKETLKIDLWTKELQVVEMDRFIFNTLRGLADTYSRATSNQKLATSIRQFVQYFGEETEILKRSND